MIQSVWAINPDGERLDLNLASSSEEEGIVVFNMTGLGPPVATINGTGGPNFDGLRVASVRADARYLVITLAVSKQGVQEEQARRTIYKYFPVKQEITFGITTDTKNLSISAFVESNEFNQFAQVENAVISLTCPAPYFSEVHELSVLLRRGGAIFEFPVWNPRIYNHKMQLLQ